MTEPPVETPPPIPLEDDVASGRDTEVRVAGFTVADLSCGERWDPTNDRLPCRYRVFDPNGQIRRGRLAFYPCPRDSGASSEEESSAELAGDPPSGPLAIGNEVGDQTAPPAGEPSGEPLFVLTLTTGELAHGAQSLGEDRRWNGRTLAGRRVTALDGPVLVRLEVWNRETDEPPADDSTDGRTARAAVMVPIDVVVSARWSRRSVVPAGDPDEPARGKASLDLRLKNVPDRTAVRILVARIGTIDNPATDRVYECSGRDAAAQRGLENCQVRDGRVQTRGDDPEVAFSNYAEHWRYPGNNFYVAWISFGEAGRWTPVTQRNHRDHEAECLHMRFTVLVHLGSTDRVERAPAIEAIGRLLNNETRYFHASVKSTPISDPTEWHRQFRHRYMVLYIGHAFGECWHPDHPRNADGFPIDHVHYGFPPDGLVCPDRYRDEAGRRASEDSFSHYGWPIQLGCGNAAPYRTTPIVGSNVLLVNHYDRPMSHPDYVQVGRRGPHRALADGQTILAEEAPRFLAYWGGCRTATTESLVAWFNQSGTQYVHGWVYSVDTVVNATFVRSLMTRWIKETGSDLGLDEWDPERFVQVYRELATAGDPTSYESVPFYNPQLRSDDGRLHFDAAPDAAEAALR